MNIKPDGVYIDCTTGGGGHSLEIVKRLTLGKLICIDRDDDALNYARIKLTDYLDKIVFIKGNFVEIDEI